MTALKLDKGLKLGRNIYISVQKNTYIRDVYEYVPFDVLTEVNGFSGMLASRLYCKDYNSLNKVKAT